MIMKNLNKKWILIIIGICLFIIIILFLFIFNNKKHLEINKNVDVLVGGYNQVITVKSIDKGFKIGSGLYPGKYVRIELEIENKKDIDSVTALEQFSIVDDNKNLITNCYHDSILPNNNFYMIFPDTIKASGVTKGYLYCPLKRYKGGKLKILVIEGGNIDKNKEITYKYKDYYIDLEK